MFKPAIEAAHLNQKIYIIVGLWADAREQKIALNDRADEVWMLSNVNAVLLIRYLRRWTPLAAQEIESVQVLAGFCFSSFFMSAFIHFAIAKGNI